MAPMALEQEDHARDAAFNKALHGKSVESSGLISLLKKDTSAQKAAVDEYFKHWDNKPATEETEATREVRCCHAIPAENMLLTEVFHLSGSPSRVRYSDTAVRSSQPQPPK
jgi:hypothetical protein